MNQKKIDDVVEKKNYALDDDVLTIQTPCGPFSFKIENEDLLKRVDSIAQMVTEEMQSVGSRMEGDVGNSKPYAMLLLSALNIAEKHVLLEERFALLTDEVQAFREASETLNPGAAAGPSTSQPLVGPSDVSTPVSASIEEEPILLTEIVNADEMIMSDMSDDSNNVDPETVHNGHKNDDAEFDDHPKETRKEENRQTQSTASETTDVKDRQGDHGPDSSEEQRVDRPISYSTETVAPNAESTSSTLSDESPNEKASVSKRSTPSPNSSAEKNVPTSDEQVESTTIPSSSQSPSPSSESTRVLSGSNASSSFDTTFSPAYNVSGEQDEKKKNEALGSVSSIPASSASSSLPESQSAEQRPSNEAATAISGPDAESSPPLPSLSPSSTSSESSDCDIIDAPSFIINTPMKRHSVPVVPADQNSGSYRLPLLSFLQNQSKETEVDQNRIRQDAEKLEKKLGYFGIKGEVMGVSPGPVITTFEYKPDPGTKISKIVNLADDLALALSAFSIRIVAPIPGKDVMGIEIPNLKKSLVPFLDIVTSDDFVTSPSKVPICLGKDIIGNPVVVQLEKMPHLLIAGATGTGKSVGLNAMITSILYKASPDEVKFLMIDPKRIELSFYNDIPHLLTPVITDMKKANIALQWMVREMDRRYNLLAQFQVRNIDQYNRKIERADEPQYDEEGEVLTPLPFIVVIIDELADLMMTASRDIELSLTRLAQMARAAGIHLILATQRPSVDVLTGIIKANFPTRISFQVSSKTDSRTIIDSNGAETLLGNGDMLFVPPGTARLTRVHGTYLSEEELSRITAFIKAQRKPNYIFDVITEQEPEEVSTETMDDEYDEKYNEALEFVVSTRQASISGIQRALRVGYNRAARIIDIMEKKGIVGPSDGIKPRQVLINSSDIDAY